ncbi:MAG: DUF1566 domain-containing protein [Candidatus Binatia bacterium]
MRLTITTSLAALAAMVLTATAALAAPTAEQKCEAGKNDAAGKYDACTAKAEKGLVSKGDMAKYADALVKCEGKLVDKWTKLEADAVAAAAVCPSTGDQVAIQNFVDACVQSVAVAVGGGALGPDPVTCNTDLGSCTGDLGTCNGSLGTCNGDLGTCNGNLGTCMSNLGGCTTDVGTCNAGTATLADVLSGETFSSSAGLGVTGTMANVGQQNATPGTMAVTITQGYHDGTGLVAGDPDLTAANIASGVDIFGVVGSLSTSVGLPKTGQTQCDQGAGTLGACPGSPAGQDGSTSRGLARSYTANANGTITDNNFGLIWESLDDNNANGIHDYSATFTWYNAFKKIQVLNGNAAGCIAANNPDTCCTGAGTGSCSAFAGQTDWRLPNVNELHSLVNFAVYPTADLVFNTNCGAGCTTASCRCTPSDPAAYTWASTSYQYNPTYAWYVTFNNGSASVQAKTSLFRVRAVRGGS